MYKINDFVIVNDYHVYQVMLVNQFYYTLSSLITPIQLMLIQQVL